MKTQIFGLPHRLANVNKVVFSNYFFRKKRVFFGNHSTNPACNVSKEKV